ncbi:NAD(P)-binding protein [Tothia fuscella]|uniref:NAD(P)-binding protein n=1 Tax=Tothia fuscella TaxID=1048955 RepID=A0A9P4TVZ3_9PEZI|nr:NAD(P)-binding protein [Tothia fuscella]
MSFLRKMADKISSERSSIPTTVKAYTPPSPAILPPNALRIVVLGAGSRGNAYSHAIKAFDVAQIVGICEPVSFKRYEYGRKYIWGDREPLAHEAFEDWADFLAYEVTRRKRVSAGEIKEGHEEYTGADGVFVCVLDEMHVHVLKGLAPLGLHIMCEKPLATSLEDCIGIHSAVTKEWEALGRKTVFGICHVLRYSPHNMLLHKLIRDNKAVGDIVSVEHTEPVGWWHFAHSYVRGNWRRESSTAPSLLTKSCHDIDFILWLLCSPAPNSQEPPHLPTSVTSTGSLNIYRRARKPLSAGQATNCLSCPIEHICKHSAKRVYVDKHFEKGNTGWPVKIAVPEIEDLWQSHGKETAREKLMDTLREDYGPETLDEDIRKRPWFGRCVFESDNDVCDDQVVTLTWNDNPIATATTTASEMVALHGRGAKTALFHMIAPTEKICERRGRIYGTDGEITYDSTTISVYDFNTGETTIHKPKQDASSGHGGGDNGLALNFVKAVQDVKDGMDAEMAQKKHLGCTIEEVVRSHVAVFMAEEARTQKKVVDWDEFWKREVVGGGKTITVGKCQS